jgi:hypothetical protein
MLPCIRQLAALVSFSMNNKNPTEIADQLIELCKAYMTLGPGAVTHSDVKPPKPGVEHLAGADTYLMAHFFFPGVRGEFIGMLVNLWAARMEYQMYSQLDPESRPEAERARFPQTIAACKERFENLSAPIREMMFSAHDFTPVQRIVLERLWLSGPDEPLLRAR